MSLACSLPHTQMSGLQTLLRAELILTCPVLNLQGRDPAKVPLIIGNKNQFAGDRLGRYDGVERTNGFTGAFKPRAHLGVRSCIAGGEFEDVQRTEETLQQVQRLCRRNALGRSVRNSASVITLSAMSSGLWASKLCKTTAFCLRA